MAFKALGVTSEDSLKIPSAQVIENLSELKDRSIGILASILNYSKNRTIERAIKEKIEQSCPWLSSKQIEEIQMIFSTVKNKVTDDNFYKLKKFSQIASDRRCQFSYLIRPNDLLVHTGLCIGSGNSKAVDLILRIEKSGEVHFLTNAKLKKEKRNPKYDQLISYEYKVRALFDSDRILAPGEMYHYFSKKGIEKLTWIVPYYHSSAADIIKARAGCSLSVIKEQDYLPLKTLRVCLLMALALKEMHKIDWIHRDVKLENFLVNIDEKSGEVQNLVLADTAFAIPLSVFNDHREKMIQSIKKRWLEELRYSDEQIRERNPLFFSLSSINKFPSVSRYQELLMDPRMKDLDSAALLNFLQELDHHLIVGTPNHIAPEIYETRSYSKKVDIYALGASFVRIKEQMEGIALFNEEVDLEFDRLTAVLENSDPTARFDLDTIISQLEAMIAIQNK